jgi:hypothetical protein
MAACAQPRLPERAKLEHASARFRALSDPARLDHRFGSPQGAARRAVRYEATHIYYSLSDSHVLRLHGKRHGARCRKATLGPADKEEKEKTP